MTAAPASGKTSFFSFPRAFYVINGIELLERGAYYTMNYVLTAYMALTIGLPAAQVGALVSVLFLLLYVIPLLGAPFAEKYGYKVGLTASFLLLAAGYASLLVARDFNSMLLSVSLIGFGAGIFKPIAAAVVSQTSSEEQRNYAFIIYYGAINLGATLVPLAVALVGFMMGIDVTLIAFAVSATISALNFGLVLTAWRNLREPQKDKSIVQALASLGDIFHHPKLLVLFVIYSGFWFLYAMSLSFLPVYMLQFERMPDWFNPLFLGTVNPAVIVLVAPFLGSLTKGIGSIQLMIGGIALYVVGFLTIGFTTTSVAAPAFGIITFLVGVCIFSVGEVLTHPSFLAYVTKIAPADKVSVFLGYGFLPIAVGLFFGAGVGGVLYGRFAQEAGQPALFWAIMSGVALVAVAALVLYNHFITPRPAAPAPAESRRRSFGGVMPFAIAVVAILLVPALIGAASMVPTGEPVEAAGTDDGALDAANLATMALPEVTDSLAEGETSEPIPFTFPEGATGVATFTLSWTDEAAPTPATPNAPDTFRVKVTAPDGSVTESEEESSGALELAIDGAMSGDYVVEVTLVDAGDSAPVSIPLVPVGATADTGNEFTLGASYQAPAEA